MHRSGLMAHAASSLIKMNRCIDSAAKRSHTSTLRLRAASSHSVLKRSPHFPLCHMQFRMCCLHAACRSLH